MGLAAQDASERVVLVATPSIRKGVMGFRGGFDLSLSGG